MESAARQAFVGAGANLGNRLATLTGAIEKLRETPGISKVMPSAIYETDPVGVENQPLYLNMVLGLETTLTPEQLLETMMRIENAFGRVRSERWAARTLDLDLLVYEGETRSSAALHLPHPRLFERLFVTVPLRELLGQPMFQRPWWHSLREKLGPNLPSQGIWPYTAGSRNIV